MPEGILFKTLITCLCVVRDILYFCAGGLVVIKTLCSNSIVKDMDTGPFRLYVVCCFIAWCWLYSKLIVL